MTTRAKTQAQFFGLILVMGLAAACSSAPLTPLPPAATRPLLLAHYMPWYQTPSVSGMWGWHWTMNHFNPNQQDSEGQAQIASHYYPHTGPYDSRDDAILEYQLALMKLSGIDGGYESAKAWEAPGRRPAERTRTAGRLRWAGR